MHIQEIHCPYCGRPELNEKTGLLNIRALKVLTKRGWESYCLICKRWFV